jgi:AcrR family transcriptional regulator
MESTTVTRKAYHHGNLRAELLDHAERALARGGVQGLSLRELAREIGVSHGAPRRHFADKQALLDALAVRGFERLGRELADATKGARSFRGRFERLARAYARFASENSALLEVMYSIKHDPEASADLRAAAERSSEPALKLIADAQAAGDVVEGDPERVALVLAATIQGLLAMSNSGLLGGAPLDELVGEAAGRLTEGLRPR